MASIITANRLHSGEVVYLAYDGAWSSRIADARTADDDVSRVELERIAAAAVTMNQLVSPYLMDVDVENGAPHPRSVREIIRASRVTTLPR